MTPAEMFERITNPPIDQYLDEGIARLKDAAAEHWPSPAHPENIYATGRSAGQFRTAGAGDSRVLENGADYSGYTDGGFTQKGAATARPWHERGSSPYLTQLADAQVEPEAQALLDLIVGPSNG